MCSVTKCFCWRNSVDHWPSPFIKLFIFWSFHLAQPLIRVEFVFVEYVVEVFDGCFEESRDALDALGDFLEVPRQRITPGHVYSCLSLLNIFAFSLAFSDKFLNRTLNMSFDPKSSDVNLPIFSRILRLYLCSKVSNSSRECSSLNFSSMIFCIVSSTFPADFSGQSTFNRLERVILHKKPESPRIAQMRHFRQSMEKVLHESFFMIHRLHRRHLQLLSTYIRIRKILLQVPSQPNHVRQIPSNRAFPSLRIHHLKHKVLRIGAGFGPNNHNPVTGDFVLLVLRIKNRITSNILESLF